MLRVALDAFGGRFGEDVEGKRSGQGPVQMKSRNRVAVRLLTIVQELESQPKEKADLKPGIMSFPKQLAQIREWVEDVNEFGLAYELLVCLLENSRLVLSGPAAIALLEVGLILGFKTEREIDKEFDRTGESR